MDTYQNDSDRRAEQAPGAQPDQEKGIFLEAQELLQQEWAIQQQFKQIEKPAAPSIVSISGDLSYSAAPAIGQSRLVSKDLAKNEEPIPPPDPAEFGTAKWRAQLVGDAVLLPFLAPRNAMKSGGESIIETQIGKPLEWNSIPIDTVSRKHVIELEIGRQSPWVQKFGVDMRPGGVEEFLELMQPPPKPPLRFERLIIQQAFSTETSGQARR